MALGRPQKSARLVRRRMYYKLVVIAALFAAVVVNAQTADMPSPAASAAARASPLGPRISFGAAARTALLPEDAADVAARAGLPLSELRAIVEGAADIGYDADARSIVFGCHAHGQHSDSSRSSSSSDPNDDNDNASDVLLPPPPRWPRSGGNGDSRRQAGQIQWRGGAAGGRASTPVTLTATQLPFSGATTPSSAQPGQDDPANLSEDAVFKLHSRPGAAAKILLDFDGHVTKDTAWNGASTSIITTPPYSVDNDTTSFSAAELKNIVAIWRQVAEDYAPWLVDVTTEDDGLPLAGRGVRAAIGGTCAILGQSDCTFRGVAYLGAFGKKRLGPAFAFSDSVADGTFSKGAPKYTADIISHEVGHTLGLGHDGCTPPGQPRQDYYSGHGAWAPIMGRPYPRPVSQWSKGEYSCATNRQDDTKIIGRRLTPVPDDHGGDAGSATPLAGAPVPGNAARSFAEVAGAIEAAGDTDMFAFAADAGPVTLSVALVPPARLGALTYARADLDMRLDLYGPGPDAASAGATPLASFDPQGALLSGAFAATLPARGTYYVALTGVGDGGPEVGYSAYASLGEYRLGAEFPTAAGGNGGTPDLAPGLRVKVDSYAGESDGAGATRVASVRLVVTDEAGAPVPRAAVAVMWSHEPTSGAPPDFSPTKKKVVKAKKAGEALLPPSPPASGPGITLRVVSVEAPSSSNGAPRKAWNRGASDVATQFTW